VPAAWVSRSIVFGSSGCWNFGIIDADVVDITNLQRRIIHHTPDIGVPKVTSAANKIAEINPDVSRYSISQLFSPDNALQIISDYDFIIDGTIIFRQNF
jgi:molybdopterin/thiamine biosynthesis adenylyltransferase